jgi:hypothetical protein
MNFNDSDQFSQLIIFHNDLSFHQFINFDSQLLGKRVRCQTLFMHLRVESCSNEGLGMMWMAWDVRKICILNSKKSRKMFKKLENLIFRTFGVFLAQ